MPGFSSSSDVVVFVLAAVASLSASSILVSRIERLGWQLGFSAALLGLIAALAADSPEITSSVTAIGRGEHAVGVGVVLGSNVFNIAALLGLGSLAAGHVRLHRRVVVLEGAVALAVAAVALLFVAGLLPAAPSAAIALLLMAAYGIAVAVPVRWLARIGLPSRALAFVALAVREEEEELEEGAPRTDAGSARLRKPLATDGSVAVLALAVVVAASVAMERSGVTLGGRLHIAPIVIGSIVLAGVTSLPNAVAAVYLARRGRGPAVLSEAMNSNALNVTVGLLLPSVVLGGGQPGPHALGVAGWYGAMTFCVLLGAFLDRGVGRRLGLLVIAAYAVFCLLLSGI
jgi:cation:H+ antiporter